jgi:hypothetical protein
VLRQGEEKNVELNLNSTSDLEPLVNFSFINNYKDLEIKSLYNSIQIPYYGEISIPVKVKALQNASISPHTIFLKAVFSLPDIEFIQKNESNGNNFVPFMERESQQKEKTVKLTVNVDKSFSLSERIGKSWEHIGGPFTFFYGIIAGLSPWIIKEIKRRINKYHKK